MKFICRAYSLEEANQIKFLLENAGIPAFVSNKRFAQLNVPFVAHSLGVFIYIKSQYQDAIALINNEQHVVREPVDVDEFYRILASSPHKEAVHNAMNNFIWAMLAIGVICALLIYILNY